MEDENSQFPFKFAPVSHFNKFYSEENDEDKKSGWDDFWLGFSKKNMSQEGELSCAFLLSPVQQVINS